MANTIWSSIGMRALRAVPALVSLTSTVAWAQAAPDPAPQPASPVVTTPAEPLVAPPPAAGPVVAPAAAVPVPAVAPAVATAPAAEMPLAEPTPTPTAPVPTPAEEPPASNEDDPGKSPFTLNAWMHMTNRVQNLRKPKQLDRFSQENELNLLFNAQIVKQISMSADIAAHYGPTSAKDGSMDGSVSILDLIAKFDLHDAFHVWAGRMLVPSDRSNFSGTWFAAPWYYPGRYNLFGAPVGPRQGFYGRNDGATVWGQFAGGMFKYYAGAFNLFTAQRPLLTGRLNLALINPEPGYYHSSTYYGSKDILALAIGGQFQKRGPMDDKDYAEFNADLLFEKNLAGSGTIDLEGAFYKYEGSATDYSYYVLASYLTPNKIGPGALQPLVRLQQAKPKEKGSDLWTIFEAQFGYAIATYAARLALGYQYMNVSKQPGHALYLGVQLQK